MKAELTRERDEVPALISRAAPLQFFPSSRFPSVLIPSGARLGGDALSYLDCARTFSRALMLSNPRARGLAPMGVHSRGKVRGRVRRSPRLAGTNEFAWRGSLATFDLVMWRTFENGRSVGTRGPEQGVIVSDEEHPRRARITLEREGRRAPWSVTCGIRGTFSHTAFASCESEARSKYSAMKRDLASMMEESDSSPCYERIRLFMDVY